jgi:UDP-N-acetylglucosamine--N-acetylmuramyl-(pentapeptide) pyrophosphoryl-undecaprenol N-acetylglucosamine transferase
LNSDRWQSIFLLLSPDLGIMRAIIAGGGTGGHLFPGIAVAREIQRRDKNAEILFVGSERGIEARLVPQEGFPLRCLPAGSMKGVGWGARLRSLVATVRGIVGAKRILREFRPAIVIGVGGYASFPMVGAAILKGYPRIVMEQNAIPGLANRILGRWVSFAAVTGSSHVVLLRQARHRHRQSHSPAIQIDFTKDSSAAVRDSGFRRQPGRAGDQQGRPCGAAFADGMENASALHASDRGVATSGNASGVRRRGFTAEVQPFFNEFHQRYASADLIVSRAGATTVAEIKAAGRAAILVPFPFAADDHQTRNAEAMVQEGAAIMIRNSELTGESLAKTIQSLFTDIPRLEAMEASAKRIAVLDAEERIVDLAEEAVFQQGGSR